MSYLISYVLNRTRWISNHEKMKRRFLSKKIVILVFGGAVLLFILFIKYDDFFYFVQKKRLQKFNSSILSEQRGFIPNIFGTNVPKVWPHRVNSVPRLQYLLNDFNGFECDVYYNINGNYFDVGHEPEKSIGLSVKTYFQLPGTAKKYFWLDFKNLDTSNEELSVALLTRLDSQYQIKNRIIIESTAPKLLKRFAENGFFTSFYIPVFDSLVHQNNKDYSKAVLKELYPGISAISQSFNNIERITTLPPGIVRLSWNFSRMITIGNQSPLEEMFVRKDVKVILVEIPNIYYR